MSDDNVTQMGFSRDPASVMTEEEWARELCKTVLRNDPSLPEAAIERKVSNYSDEQMKFICHAVTAMVDTCITKLDQGEDLNNEASWGGAR